MFLSIKYWCVSESYFEPGRTSLLKCVCGHVQNFDIGYGEVSWCQLVSMWLVTYSGYCSIFTYSSNMLEMGSAHLKNLSKEFCQFSLLQNMHLYQEDHSINQFINVHVYEIVVCVTQTIVPITLSQSAQVLCFLSIIIHLPMQKVQLFCFQKRNKRLRFKNLGASG